MIHELTVDLRQPPRSRWNLSSVHCGQARVLFQHYKADLGIPGDVGEFLVSAARNFVREEHWEEMESLADELSFPVADVALCNFYYDALKVVLGRPFPVELVMRTTLEDARTFDDAVRVLRESPLPCDCLLLVTGIHPGELVVIERTPTRHAISGRHPLNPDECFRSLADSQVQMQMTVQQMVFRAATGHHWIRVPA